MFDIYLRGLKDHLYNSLVQYVPAAVTPGHLTTAGFLFGILCCITAAIPQTSPFSVSLWLINRFFDCLDGTLARHRHEASDSGAFYDLLCDFIVYSAIPIAVGMGQSASDPTYGAQPVDSNPWVAIAFVEATFHINNFVLFYCAAIEAKPTEYELTSVTMKPAPIEGFESGLLFTAMLVFQSYVGSICWVMGVGVVAGIVTRSWSLFAVLSKSETKRREKRSKECST